MAETQVLGWGTQTAPAERSIDGHLPMLLLAVDATFDGTGAAGSFVPAVQVISDSGQEVGVFPLQSTLAAGDSASVTFAPFLRSDSGGIKFDTDPQQGDWLVIETTGSHFGRGMSYIVDSGAFHVEADDATFGQIDMAAPFIRLDTAGCSFRLLDSGETFFTGGSGASWSFGNLAIEVFGPTSIGRSVGGGDTTVSLSVGTSFIVADSAGNPIFKVDENGDLHGKTGKALVFDL